MPNEWDSKAYQVDFISDFEAEFVYDETNVCPDSVYQH